MKYFALILLVFGLLYLVSCTKKNVPPPPPAPPTEISSTDLTARLANHFIKDPKTQAEKDQNTIVGYAIDKDINVQRTSSGLYYQILQTGSGKTPNATSSVKAHYTGKLLNGKIFDSSIERGKPLEFRLNQVIRGWQEAIQLLRPGGKGIFLIPSRLAYGAEGFGHEIPADAPLVFEIELLEVR